MNNIFNLKLIYRITSIILFIISASFLVCMGIALLYSENVYPFTYSLYISMFIGVILFALSKDVKRDITIKDAYFIVTFSWLLLSLIGTLPYLFSQVMPTFTDDLFESVSGFTTTGSSILVDIEALPKSILFWRSLTNWIGGIGIIMLVVIILPSLKISGYYFFVSESSFHDKFKPKIHQVGRRLLLIYISLTAIEVVLLLLGKMSLFESICNSFGTIATGGFSPKNTSIADYSPYIQYIIMIFMFLSGTNFIIHYNLVKGRFLKIKKNEEFKLYTLLILIIGGIITASLFFQMGKPFEISFREAFFQIVSIITTTGFATADYLLWPKLALIMIFFSLFLGGSSGSTSGGIKIFRHLIIFKSIRNRFRQIAHPQLINPIRINNERLSVESKNTVLSFVILYIITFVIGTILTMAFGLDGKTASSSVATCMAGIGPGIGTIGPVSNFAHIPQIDKILLSFLMIIGRLEIYSVIILFTKDFWKS